MANEQNLKTQIAERIKQANNILVTVSSSPSVDQLAAAIGTTLLLNKLGKHATAVFSGEVPSTIEFLRPESTIEKTTDSLRDFIIALDKTKADKLRYKVEDKVVKIFITPYRTQITEKDLEFSQGDFNVEVVLALGVHKKEELDQAITAHGRILHDATVISMNIKNTVELGNINWVEPASSLCELGVVLSDLLGENLLDDQIATAFLTGIVAETNRFSNEKAAPQTMSVSGKLMSAGASSQLVAKELEQYLNDKNPPPTPPAAKEPPKPAPKKDDGTLNIAHTDEKKEVTVEPNEEPETEEDKSKIDIDHEGTMRSSDELNTTEPKPTKTAELPSIVTEPPTLGGRLTANTQPEPLDSTSDVMSQPQTKGPLLAHDEAGAKSKAPDLMPVEDDQKTLSEIEQKVRSPHLEPPAPVPDLSHLDTARSAVEEAFSSGQPDIKPLEGVGAQPMVDLNPPEVPAPNLGLPPNLMPPEPKDETAGPPIADGPPPPPVPPPLMPPAL